MNCNRIKKIAEEKGLSLAVIAAEISMTENELRYALRYKTIRVIDLENIANILGVDATAFFNRFYESFPINMKYGTMIQKNEGIVRYDLKDHELKIKYRELKQQNLFYFELIKNIMEITAEILVKFIERYPESHVFLIDQKEVRKFVINIKTVRTINKSEFIFNQDFYRYFENN